MSDGRSMVEGMTQRSGGESVRAWRQIRPQLRWAWGSVLVLILGITGCKGCLPDPLVQSDPNKATDIDEIEKKKKEKAKLKEDFEFQPAMVVPGELSESRSFVKPGHWVTVRHQVKANHFDYQADLFTRATDSMGEPLEIEHTPFHVSSSRPLQLPKGQDKVLETSYFVPVVKQTDLLTPKSVWLHRELRAARGGRLVKEDIRQGTVAMPLYQYHFVVLSDEPARLSYIQSLPTASSPTSMEADTNRLVFYRVFAPVLDRYAPLPAHALTWTSIAYVLWDDQSPDILTLDQQQALVDWLHFGGQLILSGAGSLEKLRGSFLEPYLPAIPGNTTEVTAAAIDELNENWSLTEVKTGNRRLLASLPGKPILAAELTLAEGAQYVPKSGKLLVELPVGNGRVVASTVSLGDSRLLQWGSLDNFFHGAILRRPRRRFENKDGSPDTVFVDFPQLVRDSRFSTTVRFFSRDISVFSTEDDGRYRAVVAKDDVYPDDITLGTQNRFGPTPDSRPRPTVNDIHPDQHEPHLRGYWSGWRTSMASWNDRSGAANAARQALKDAAGISIPKGSFVLKVLAIYLAVLAPLNWLIFRLLGKVEWAWVAAPVIALVGAFVVVRTAQLDIGFARSRTEVGIIEGFGGFSRAHVTRYAALYSSLTTSYDLEFSEDGAQALPFAASEYQRRVHDSVYEVTMRRDQTLKLSGFLVPSNTTGTVHSEQLLDLGGKIQLVGSESSGWRIDNGTPIHIRVSGVLRRRADGSIERSWIGDLRPKSSVPLKFVPVTNEQVHFPEWDQAPETLSYDVQAREILARLDQDKNGKLSEREAQADPRIAEQFSRLDQLIEGRGDRQWTRDELLRWCRLSRAGDLSLGQMCELASQALRLIPGEFRLIGLTEDEVAGATAQPAASQQLVRSLVLIHLRPGEWTEPRSDVNLIADVVTVEPEPANPDPLSPDAPSSSPPTQP